MRLRTGCASIGGSIFGARSASIPNDQAQMTVCLSAVLDDVEELLASKRESARGPGGLPSSVYRCAGCIGAKLLCAACQAKGRLSRLRF